MFALLTLLPFMYTHNCTPPPNVVDNKEASSHTFRPAYSKVKWSGGQARSRAGCSVKRACEAGNQIYPGQAKCFVIAVKWKFSALSTAMLCDHTTSSKISQNLKSGNLISLYQSPSTMVQVQLNLNFLINLLTHLEIISPFPSILAANKLLKVQKCRRVLLHFL